MAMAGKQAIERAREPPALGGRSTLTPGRSSGKYTWPRFSAPFFPTRRRRRQPRVRRALPVPRPGPLRGAGSELRLGAGTMTGRKDRTSVVQVKGVAVRVELGGGRAHKKKK